MKAQKKKKISPSMHHPFYDRYIKFVFCNLVSIHTRLHTRRIHSNYSKFFLVLHLTERANCRSQTFFFLEKNKTNRMTKDTQSKLSLCCYKAFFFSQPLSSKFKEKSVEQVNEIDKTMWKNKQAAFYSKVNNNKNKKQSHPL